MREAFSTLCVEDAQHVVETSGRKSQMRVASVLAHLVFLHIVASSVVASPLTGEWTLGNGSERRLVLRADGSFELSLSGRSPVEESFTVHLDMTPDGGFFGYGITANHSAGQSVDLPMHVYQISVPLESQQSRKAGAWAATDSFLLLSTNELEISHVNGRLVVEYVASLVRQELESETLVAEARSGFSAALENVAPILLWQADPFEQLTWEISLRDGALSTIDPNGKFTGNWRNVSTDTAVALSSWATVKSDLSP
jgi:hypothetical protein